MKSFSVLVSVLMMAGTAHAAAPASFAQCSVCHAVTKGAPAGIGPTLAGVVGRKAGSAAGFSYSSALKGSKIVWSATTLDKWITNPAALVPGNKMPYGGLSDAHKRAEIIAYLKTVK